MTHTSAGLWRDDVKVEKGNFFGFGRGAAYGWENAKRLAKTLPYVDQKKENACDNNADSLAYFALGTDVNAIVLVSLLTKDRRLQTYVRSERSIPHQ
jgi:hypothetical protein